ncbi:DUF3576 domain-containing protein [Candidatus Pelagibacter sp.]|nr:DUF3576 domain-containing protein [Candidatus Pelagibacter sp.]
MKILVVSLVLITFLFQSACGPLKYKKVSAKDFPPDPKLRVQKNMEEGRGFRIMDKINTKGTSYEFASSNPLWRATLDTLDFMPLTSANYSGGIVITDWYSEDGSPNESIKITVKFLTNEIRSDAISVDVFVKQCSQNLINCSINKQNDDLVAELTLSILKKASIYETQRIEKYKKENPYVLSTPSKERDKKKKD